MRISLRLFARNLLALLAGFRKADGDRLFAALDLAAFAARTALGLAAFVAMYLAFYVFARALRVFPFLCHKMKSMNRQMLDALDLKLLDRKALGLDVTILAHVKLATTGRDAIAMFEGAIRGRSKVL